jgi:iron(III) transport system permease protein
MALEPPAGGAGGRLRPLWAPFIAESGRPLTGWTILTLLAVALVLLPIVSVLVGSLGGSSETWGHLASTVLADYVGHSLLLVLGVGCVTLVLGVSTAWLITTCEFPGRRLFEWSLILPLAIPTYIMAYTYAEILRGETFLGAETAAVLRSNLMTLPGAGLVIALALYPYVYLITRASFMRQSGSILETARILGKSSWQTFARVALPMARPGVVAGLTLVLMEVLNEYGAVRYFGVTTFTTGIFRAWFSLGDPASAIRLAALLLLFVFALILFERAQRGRARFADKGQGYRPIVRFRLSGARGWGAAAACGLPVLFGFVLPVFQLLGWGASVAGQLFDARFLSLTFNSFVLGIAAATITVFAGLLIAYSVRLSPTRLLRLASRASSLGYSIPGAVIAVGILIPFTGLDRTLSAAVGTLTGSPPGLILTGTVAALLFAYLVRFLAVALNPIESGFERTCAHLDESSRSLGASPLRTLREVDIPLLRGTLFSAGLLVFVDVLKELPLTLILRPFDFDTLATRAFQLAMDEQVAESALPALLVILVGLVPVIVLSRLMGRHPEYGMDGEPAQLAAPHAATARPTD